MLSSTRDALRSQHHYRVHRMEITSTIQAADRSTACRGATTASMARMASIRARSSSSCSLVSRACQFGQCLARPVFESPSLLGIGVTYPVRRCYLPSSAYAVPMNPKRPEAPNHALQRTAPCVTAPASTAALPPAMQVPRRTPRSLSLGSLGGITHHALPDTNNAATSVERCVWDPRSRRRGCDSVLVARFGAHRALSLGARSVQCGVLYFLRLPLRSVGSVCRRHA